MSENAASSRRTATRSLVLCALMAALTAICSQIQIPLPMVPINLALFAVHLSGALLGWKYGALSMVVYALLGVIGVPVFAGFGSGPAVLFGKTGGYILGYILCALIVGALSRKFAFNFKTLCLSMVLGVAVCYAFGTIWFMAVTGLNLATSMRLLRHSVPPRRRGEDSARRLPRAAPAQAARRAGLRGVKLRNSLRLKRFQTAK